MFAFWLSVMVRTVMILLLHFMELGSWDWDNLSHFTRSLFPITLNACAHDVMVINNIKPNAQISFMLSQTRGANDTATPTVCRARPQWPFDNNINMTAYENFTKRNIWRRWWLRCGLWSGVHYGHALKIMDIFGTNLSVTHKQIWPH